MGRVCLGRMFLLLTVSLYSPGARRAGRSFFPCCPQSGFDGVRAKNKDDGSYVVNNATGIKRLVEQALELLVSVKLLTISETALLYVY